MCSFILRIIFIPSLAEIGMKLICEQAIKECELCGGTKNNEDIETEDCKGLAHIFQDMLTNIYVDDVFLGAKDIQHARTL